MRRLLQTRWLGRRHIHLAECGSTNDLAAAESRQGADEGLIVTADAQTGGRGRLGRTWHSPAGANIYLSVLLRPRRPAGEIPPLTLLVGGALAKVLRALDFDVSVKWPNDLLLRTGTSQKKVAGILTEASSEGDRIGHVVVGIGLNVNTASFPTDLQHTATSLRLARGAPLSRPDVLVRMLEGVEEAYDDFRRRGPPAAVDLWERHAQLGTRCRIAVDGGIVEGVATGVDAAGALQVRDDQGVMHGVVAGEVNSAG